MMLSIDDHDDHQDGSRVQDASLESRSIYVNRVRKRFDNRLVIVGTMDGSFRSCCSDLGHR
jgi:hypothetical protein